MVTVSDRERVRSGFGPEVMVGFDSENGEKEKVVYERPCLRWY